MNLWGCLLGSPDKATVREPPVLGDHPQEEGIFGSRMNEVPTGDIGNQNEPGHPTAFGEPE